MTTATVVYALFLAGWVTAGLTAVVGLIVAYSARWEAGEAARSHLTFAIRTFWGFFAWILIGFLIALVGTPLVLVFGLGLAFWHLAGLIWAVVGLWFMARAIMGLVYVVQDQPYPRPRAWLI